MQRFVFSIVIVFFLTWPTTAHADEDERTMWPAHLAGIVAVGALGSAAIFGSLELDASHGSEVMKATIAKTGGSPSARTELANYQQRETTFQGTIFASAGIAVGAAAIAIIWIVIAPAKSPPPVLSGRF